jgi:hypothetical protein
MADLLGVETGWVWLRDPASDRFYNAAVQSLPPYLQEPVRMTGRSCWCLELFRSGQLTARNIDVVECSRLSPAVKSQPAALTHGLRCHASVCCVPEIVRTPWDFSFKMWKCRDAAPTSPAATVLGREVLRSM